MNKYDHKKIEKDWQKKWEEEEIYKVADEISGKKNLYTLVEFPYPSGNLHVGHWYAFSVPDIFVRAKKMQGANVLFPIGFDAFGLPAENAAIKNGINPRTWTYDSIDYMKKQLRSMGASFDWSREVATCDPEYYRWTQWMFLQFYKKGLAFQGQAKVNWCPSCKTVLANEQVVSGACERCGHEVEQKNMTQWMLKISDYAEKLLDGLEKLDWPEEIKESQRNWIGKSEGALIRFKVSESDNEIEVFTTRPDTIFGATYMVLAPEHPLVQNQKSRIKNYEEVESYVKAAGRKTERQRLEEVKNKTGVELKGIKAINPATKEEIPIWVADYVLENVGTGAIMAVPAHDERDFEFAKKFKLAIRKVVEVPDVSDQVEPGGSAMFGHLESKMDADVWTGDGELINSGKYNGQQSDKARGQMALDFGKPETQYRIRNWTVSRQRYWGVPIPMIHCEKCGVQPVPEKDLPVELPDLQDFKPKDDGKSPLARAEDWVEVPCPECGGIAERETDTLDTFVDSSWYFLRYTDPHNKKVFADLKKMEKWMPIDIYSGGSEHTTMHVLYSRFWFKALHDLGFVPWDEPYTIRKNRGLILGPDGAKMSKSKGNVIDPDEYVEKVGADTVRMYLAFIGPYNEVGSYPWDVDGILGIRRFLERVWKIYELGDFKAESDDAITASFHKTIKKVTEDIDNFKFNTAIAQLMTLVNTISNSEISQRQAEILLQLIAPFAPHFAEQLWREGLSKKESIHLSDWPVYDHQLVVDKEVKIPVQINGKVKATVVMAVDASGEEARTKAESEDQIQKYLQGKEIVKFVYVPGKIINFVIK